MSEDGVKDYVADAVIAPDPVAPDAAVPETAAESKKRRTRSTFKREEPAAPSAEPIVPLIEERTRLEIEAGAAILRQNQERLKKVQ